jgi:hypothetical protein
VKRAIRRVHWTRLREGWLRTGRIFGDAVARVLLSLVYLLALPLFAIAQKISDPERTGWKTRKLDPSVEAARRQF